MKTLEEIKDEVAQRHNYSNWVDLMHRHLWGFPLDHDRLLDEVAKRYAEQAIERCAEVAETRSTWGDVDKNTILEIKNELR